MPHLVKSAPSREDAEKLMRESFSGTTTMRRKASRPLFLALGFIALTLGFIGVFLPVLPTTPFVLVAAFAFARSSKKHHQWLLRHKYYGPLISNWQKHGVIRPRAKWTAVALILLLGGSSILILDASPYVKFSLVIFFGCVIRFILTRPGGIRAKSEQE